MIVGIAQGSNARVGYVEIMSKVREVVRHPVTEEDENNGGKGSKCWSLQRPQNPSFGSSTIFGSVKVLTGLE